MTTELAQRSDALLYATDQWLHLTGPDAAAFAQAQFCSDVATLRPGTWQYSAWLDAQGRVRAFFHVLRTSDDAFHLLLRGGEAAPLVPALQRFVFRAKVRVAAEAPTASALGGAPVEATGERTFGLSGDRLHLHEADLVLQLDLAAPRPVDPVTALAEIRAGVPRLPSSTLAELLPAWLDFERLGAISFRKGCYPGQEVAARMHFRGANSRHLRWVRVTGDGTDPSGERVRRADGAEAGWLLQAVPVAPDTFEALAVLRDGSVAGELHIGDASARSLEVLSSLWSALD